eukprot:m.194640 g.194640  ORF g.194640 m.194640 type:complete len:588 (-) comp17621_c1_seq1:37-1800(-)
MKWAVSRTDGCSHCGTYKGRRADGEAIGLARFTKVNRYVRQRVGQLVCARCPPDQAWCGRLRICLHCVFVGCVAHGHIQEHCEQSKHPLSLELGLFQVFCGVCKDAVYDRDLERVCEFERGLAAESKLPSDPGRVPFVPWQPRDASEALLLMQQAALEGSRNWASRFGLRGLVNLGNTCFSNCIIQALVHNPLLRNYFLASMHNHKTTAGGADGSSSLLRAGDRVQARWKGGARWYPASIAKVNDDGTHDLAYEDGKDETGVSASMITPAADSVPGGGEAVPPDGRETCLGCAMTNVFNELYSGDVKQFAPYRLLHAVWQQSKHLAGYAQQDAHEFFIALLDGLHKHCGGDDGHGIECTCIIHRIFTGGLQSDVTCASCKSVSTTVDPFWDISLDIVAGSHDMMPPGSPMSPTHAAVLQQQPPWDGSDVTLLKCLERFTRAERLGSNERYSCAQCKERQMSTKKLSMKRLPVVICIHLKRFKHDQQATKINTPVKFTEQLDMQPYLAAPPPPAGDDGFKYTLFAVVNHKGSMEHGHYTCFVRSPQQGGLWFLCNDETVTIATLRDVLSSEAYMLFYIKVRLEYGVAD